jgi:hypothetical protein
MGCPLSPKEILDDFKSFYYETALSAYEPNLLAIEKFVQHDHILFGSDFPGEVGFSRYGVIESYWLLFVSQPSAKIWQNGTLPILKSFMQGGRKSGMKYCVIMP